MSTPHAVAGSKSPPDRMPTHRPDWVAGSPLLIRAYALAAAAYGDERRPDDNVPLLEHAVETAGLLREAGCDQPLVAAALLHAAVEGGTLDENRLRAEIGGQVADLIPALGDDAELSSFEDRKRALQRRFAPSGS